MDNNCPVCGKAGLPDYRTEEVVCPACNTPLKAFMLLGRVGNKQKNKGNSVLWAMLCLLLLVSLVFIFNRERAYKQIQQQNKEEIAFLNEKIVSLEAEKANGNEVKTVTPDFVYTIKKGDSFCSISQKIFGTEKKALVIAETNQMRLSSKLIAGNKILIPFK